MLQEARSSRAALLRVELDAEEGAGLGDRDDPLGVRDRGRRLRGVGVREVERLATGLDSSPADARDATIPQPNGSPGKQAEARDAAVLLGLLERELQPEADPERRAAACDPASQRLVEAPIAQARSSRSPPTRRRAARQDRRPRRP